MNVEQARSNMIKQQIRTWNVLEPQILDLLMTTPRELFVPAAYRDLAFADTNIPLGHDQAMLTPKEEAFILQELHIQPHERVLEIGTGTGYFTALLAKQAKTVTSVDIFPEFTQQASIKLAACQIHNVELHTADAARGFTNGAPFDVIVITGSLVYLPDVYKECVSVSGRLFAIIGQAPTMEATLLTRTKTDQWQSDMLFETVVAPLIHAKQPSAFVF